jgi:carboxyl-terminal processing protease
LNINKIFLPLIIATALSIGIFLGYKIQQKNVSETGNSSLINPKNSSRLSEIIRYIEGRYKDKVELSEIEEGAIHELLKELDPHSVFIPVKEMFHVNEDMNGEFEGIGIEFYILKDTIMVVTPISGGPSEQLGIRSGDKIIYIDDSIVAGIGITNMGVVSKLKGPKGTKVKASIKRNGTKELIDFNITRDKIPLVSVDAGFLLNDKTGYIKINRFSATTYREFMEKLDPLVNKFKIEHLIIDLRQNPGGYLEEAIKIADELLSDRKDILYTEGYNHPKKIHRASKPGMFEEGKLTILVDEGSASASEILAGAIQDWDRGEIIGRRTFGKGLVQEQYALRDGSALRLTVAEYFTPSGRNIQKPYNPKNGEDYTDEIYNRYETGEAYNLDSLKINDTVKFYSLIKNKPLFGGGGVMPDIFIPADTFENKLIRNLYSSDVFNQYIYDITEEDLKLITKYPSYKQFFNNYYISDNDYKKFVAYAIAKGIEDKESLFYNPITRQTVNNRIKSLLAKRIWKNDGLYYVLMMQDKAVQKSISNKE